MANPAKSWTITPAQYEALEAKVNAAGLGVTISGPSGTASKAGATVGWVYDGTTLTITVEHALPFTAGTVMGKIAAAVDQALAAS